MYSGVQRILNFLTMHVLSIDPVTIREQSQLNCALLISPRWPIKICNILQKREFIYFVYILIYQYKLQPSLQNVIGKVSNLPHGSH